MEVSTAPFQYALSTRAGCECIVRVLQTLTELNPEATVTSIDKAMVEGLARVPGRSALLPCPSLPCPTFSVLLGR